MFFDTRYHLNLLEVSCQTTCAAAATEIVGRLGYLSVYGREAILASFFASLIDGIAQKIFRRRHPMRHLAAAISGFIGVAFQHLFNPQHLIGPASGLCISVMILIVRSHIDWMRVQEAAQFSVAQIDQIRDNQE